MNEFFCPIEDHTCPYCQKDGLCSLGQNARLECSDAEYVYTACEVPAEDWEDDDLEQGFDPYEGAYTYDC